MTANNQEPVTRENMLRRISAAWQDIQAYLSSLSPDQMNGPHDAAGWTVRDHVIHLAKWTAGIAALLRSEPRWVAMGISRETWYSGVEVANKAIYQACRDMPLDAVLAEFETAHTRLVRQIEEMPEEGLFLPYNHYDPESERDQPVFWWIVGNSFEHYAQHMPWMAAITAQK